MIVFQNPGLIDLDAALVMGVNAKLGESPIGFFGTGLKYAMATLLRNNCRFRIFRGVEEFQITTQKLSFRDKNFDLVWLNGSKLGFTTDLGRNWKPWQAYRELYSNAKDEGGQTFQSNEVIGLPNTTTIAV